MMRGVSDAPTPSGPAAGEPEPTVPLLPLSSEPTVVLPTGPAAAGTVPLPQPLLGGPAPAGGPGGGSAGGSAGGGLAPVPPAPPSPRPEWGARFIVLGIGAVAGIAGYLAATRFLPRWWAHRVGAMADGSFTAGVSTGLVCGLLFTLLPLLVLRGVARRSATWPTRFLLVVLAFLLAVPNLITLFVVLGTNAAAHAAERTFDVAAPGFRGATLVGALVGAVSAIGIWYLAWFLRRRRRQVEELRARLADREAARPDEADEADQGQPD